MKYFAYIFFLMMSATAFGQSKKERIAMANAQMLEAIVFRGEKDSVALDKLFAKELKYEHSHGQIQNRAEAMAGILHNKSTYVVDLYPIPFSVKVEGDSIFVGKAIKAVEKKEDGTKVDLDLQITTVWIKENGGWKLARRKATIIDKKSAGN